jgi:signal transduction histidine kinase
VESTNQMNEHVTELSKCKQLFEQEKASKQEIQKLLELKNAELLELTQLLENRVKEEVEKNAQKERILFQQSKMASMGEMISNIAHQWRQPLQAIGITTQKLQVLQWTQGSISDTDIDEMVTKVSAQLEFLSKTIDDFRSFFRPDKAKGFFHVDKCVTKTLSILDATLTNKGITLECDLTKIEIYNLENELTQVLINLIKNAIDILVEKNLEYKHIKISTYLQEEYACISILDNGGGVPADIEEKIFEPYFTTKHQSQGTGLGLYMSHEIVHKHLNGILSLENVEYEADTIPYKGACFTIKLPLKN